MRAVVGENFYAKIPMTLDGLRAVSLCKAEGIHTTVTAVFTPMQALCAAEAGADFVAPYVDRLDNITSDGAYVVREIVELFQLHQLSTQVLAASFKNVQQVYNAAAAGAHTATVTGELCRKLIFRHPHIFGAQPGLEGINDWDALKNKEKGRTTLAGDLESVPKAMPALMRAAKLQKRAERRLGQTPPKPDAAAQAAAQAAAGGPDAEEAVGRLLFEAVRLARAAGVDPEQALQRRNEQFLRQAAGADAE